MARSHRRRRRLHNPRRHHSRRRHHNRRRYHNRRRRHLRNPRSGGGSRVTLHNLVREAVLPAAIGGTGALVLDVVMGYLNPYLPTQLQSGWFNLLAKGAAAVGLGMVAGKFLGRSRGHVVMIGALTVTAYSAIRSATAGMGIPGLSGYSDYTPYPMGRLGYVNPGAVIAPTMTPRLGAYMRRATGVPAAPGQLSAYMPMNVASAAPDFGDGM